MMYCFFFKQKTAYEMRISDWSSDVCSSDLLAEPAYLGDPLPIGLIKVQASVGRHDAVAAAVELPDPAIPFDGPPTMERHIRKTNDGLPVLELVPRSVDLGIADCQQGAHCGRCQPVLR